MKTTLAQMLPVGTMLFGYCDGYFGRDSYTDKEVEAVGVDWVVVRTDWGPEFAAIPEEMIDAEMFERWKDPEAA